MYGKFNAMDTVLDGENIKALVTAEYVCDEASDLSDIPTGSLLMGTLAYVISEKKLYIMDSTGTWNATA